MKIRTILLPLLVIVALLLAACPAPEPAAPASDAAPAEATEAPAEEAASDTAESADGGSSVIKIATQSPLSGPQSVLGTAIKNGAQLALEQNKADLEAMGYTIELAPFDDQATPDTGVANAKQIVGDPDILCLVGHLNSGVMIPSSEEYHNAGLAAVSPANTNPIVTDRGYAEVNRIVGRDDVQGVVGEEFARGDLGVQSVDIIHDKTAYGQGVAEFFRQSAEKNSVNVLGFEGTEEQANFDSLITPILAANPDLIYFGGIYSQAGIFFRQAREKGVEATFMGPDGMDSSELATLGGDAVAGMYYSSVAGPANVYEGTAQFITDYEARFGESTQPFAAQAYDSMNICLTAIATAAEANGGAKPSRAQVAEAVRATKDFPGITGNITFNGAGDKTSATYFVLQVQSADPADWNNNEVVKSLDIAAPSE
ncbi:MAG: branched-chain amino acid ABC transporter substrate-binding protein [Caldilineaceae bacterium]|nr:branched-chain amino acid ABC transporter substrate-binding protein [Caldilineaceae bacterium]